MTLSAEEITKLIKKKIPDAKVSIVKWTDYQ